MELVRKTAVRMARRLPVHVDLDDLVSAGTIGLLEAAERYDPKRSDNFAGFADLRIRGAMLDDLRRRDSLSRDMRRLSNQLRDASRHLEAELGRTPDQEEIALALGLRVDELYARQQKLSGSSVVGIDDAGPDLFDRVPDLDAVDPVDHVERVEIIAMLERAAQQLPVRTRAALALRYRDGWNMKEIGVAMGYTEARACQVLHEAHGLMRAELAKAGLEEI